MFNNYTLFRLRLILIIVIIPNDSRTVSLSLLRWTSSETGNTGNNNGSIRVDRRGLSCLLFHKTGEDGLFGRRLPSGYGEFDSVSGLKIGATVEIAGVNAGRVDGITLDTKSGMARVRLQIDNGISFT